MAPLTSLLVLASLFLSSGAFAEDTLPPEPEHESVASVTEDFDPRIPRFTVMRPEWSFQFSGSLKAFGDKNIDERQGATNPARAIRLSWQYQPAFLQSFGIISLGPSFTIYPLPPGAGVTPKFYSIWSAGGEIQYQARFFREQPLVPYAGYAMEYLSYTLTGGATGRLTAKGVFFGGSLLLNWFEPRAAAAFFSNHGVTRSYLFGELRGLEATGVHFSLSGTSLFFGVRIEWI